MAEETIGNWTQSTLIRFLRDFQDQQPQQFFSKMRIDQLQVDSLLNLKPTSIALLTANDYTIVGEQGAPPFENSWVWYGGAGTGKPGFWKDPLGFVHLKGLAKSGTINTAIFTLPPGYRPQELVVSAVMSNNADARVDVNPSGTVVSVTGSNVYVSLDNITFRTTL